MARRAVFIAYIAVRTGQARDARSGISPLRSHDRLRRDSDCPDAGLADHSRMGSSSGENTVSEAQDGAASVPSFALHDLARALNLTLATIRKAQGKRNPSELEPGTSDWHAAIDDFANDLIRYGYLTQLG
jgi:hypothetical protein